MKHSCSVQNFVLNTSNRTPPNLNFLLSSSSANRGRATCFVHKFNVIKFSIPWHYTDYTYLI